MVSSLAVISTVSASAAATTTPLFVNYALEVVGKQGLAMMAVSGTAAAASFVSIPSTITAIRGGSLPPTTVRRNQQQSVEKKGKEKSSSSSAPKLQLTPQGKSVIWMALGMVCNSFMQCTYNNGWLMSSHLNRRRMGSSYFFF
jgi:hypothetical protein